MLLVDGRGIPVSIVLAPANRHDVTQLEPTFDSLVVRRPRVGPPSKQHLCADSAFKGAVADPAIRRRRYVPHVRSRREEHRTKKCHPPRRWVVEVAHSWFNRFRKLLVPLREDPPLLPSALHARRRHHLLRSRTAARQHY